MSTQVQFRRGTEAENASFTGVVGEVVYITDTDRLVMHDGSTAGGILIPNSIDIQNQQLVYGLATGTTTMSMTLSFNAPTPSAYATGQAFTFKSSSTNTGGVTMNINSLGAKTVKKKDVATGALVALVAGDIIAGSIYTIYVAGTDFVIDSVDSGGDVSSFDLLATATASASASLDFESVITSEYSNYMFVIDKLVTTTLNTNVYLRTSTNNGTSYDNTLGDYAYASSYLSPNGVSASPPASTSAQQIFLNASGFGRLSTTSGSNLSGVIYLDNPHTNVGVKNIRWFIGSGVPTVMFFVNGAGQRTSQNNVDAVQFLLSSGNIASGTIRLYGMKASV